MKLNERVPANDVLDDPPALATRFNHDGCLLVRDGFDPQ